MLENLFNSPFLTSLAITLLHFLWQGVLVAMVLKSALFIFNNNKPQLRYVLSAIAMLANFLLPIITFIIVYRGEVSSVHAITHSLALTEFIQELKQPDALFSYKELSELLLPLLPYVSLAWLTTITLLAGKLLLEISTVNKLPQQGALAPSDKLQSRFEQLAKQIQLKITPRLLISLKVEVPMAIGWLKPVVLLPASMVTGLNNAQLEMLILHELAHIRRHDYLVNFLQTLVEILLFFHPAVLWVSRQMRNEREYCSDDIAVQHCGDAVAYAHTLADTASLCRKNHTHTIPDMAMAASGGDLKQRVIRLVDHHCAPKNNISKWFASATIIFSVLLLSSKQLLTMPLLDIWYNDNPWKQQSFTAQNSEKSQVMGINASLNFPNSSIAQQLLTPESVVLQQQERQSVQQTQNLYSTKSQAVEVKSLVRKAAEPTHIEVTRSAQSTGQQLVTNSEANLINEKLDQLSAKVSPLPREISTTIDSNSLMVKAAFARTNSSNPYQKELSQLAIEQNTASTTKQSLGNETLLTTVNSQQNNRLSNDNTRKVILDGANINKTIAVTTVQNKVANNINTRFATEKATSPTTHIAEQLKSVDPVYPSVAKRKGIELEVKVNFTIGVDGQIKDLKFARQNKINYFKSSIRSAIKKWRFLPAKVDGQPVESQMAKVFAFSLKS